MKRLLIIFIFCFISHSAYADKIQGHFFCEEKFPDGSGSKFTLKINGTNMSNKDIRDDKGIKYKEVYFSDYLDEQYTIFVMKEHSSQFVYILSPTENKNKISTTFINTVTYKNKSSVAKGMCDRI